MALTTLSFSLSHLSQMKTFGAFQGRNQLLNARGNQNNIFDKNDFNTRKRFSPITIKSFNGQFLTPETLARITTTVLDITGHGNGSIVPSTVVPQPTKDLSVNDFPVDFKFGASSSALQTEGSLNVDGRGPSGWDSLITDGLAADSYNRYKEDVQALKKMGADTYRFSISWSRILPDGTVSGGINPKGLEFYNNLINELVNNGITPFVSLLHFDLPVALQNKYNGFLSTNIVEDFKNFADVCFKNFGDRVKYWSTINEPQVFGQYIYTFGLPSTTPQNPVTDPFTATHNLLLAHGAACKHYKDTYKATQKGEIGIALSALWALPHSNTPEDKRASTRTIDFGFGWLLDPLVYGDYPFSMKALIGTGLPQFTDEEKALVKGSCDYIGINYYSSRFAKTIPISHDQVYTDSTQFQHADSLTTDVNGNAIGEQVNNEMYIYPKGLRDVLVFLKEDYGNPKVYITENGTPDREGDGVVEDPINDTIRIEYMQVHLRAILEAIKLGANVKGFFNWSLMDVKELASAGYETRMGLIHIAYPNRDRIPKKSSEWLGEFLSKRNTKALVYDVGGN